MEDEETEIQDNWYSDDDEFDANIEAQDFETFGFNKI